MTWARCTVSLLRSLSCPRPSRAARAPSYWRERRQLIGHNWHTPSWPRHAHGLDVVLFIGGVLAVVSAVGALALIRTKDFEASSQRSHNPAQAVGAGRDPVAEPARA